MPKTTQRVRTDAHGRFEKTREFDAPMGGTVRIRARLLSPRDTRVLGTLEVAWGDQRGQSRSSEMSLGADQTDLGDWKVSRGRNLVVVHGSTVPPRADTELEFEFDLSPRLFG